MPDAADEPRSATSERPNAPPPSFLPPDAADSGEGFLDRLAPSLLPSNDGAPPASPKSVPPPLPKRERAPEPAPTVASPAGPLEAQRSSASGLISAILARDVRPEGAPDEGARAALRTLPFRARRGELETRSPAQEAERLRARIALLEDLAERQTGGQKARLLATVADLLAKHPERADAAKAAQLAAREADPSDLVALRRQAARALRNRDLDEARQLYGSEAELPLTAAEHALTLCAIAEIDAAKGAPDAALLASLQAATNVDPGSLVPNLLRARLELAAGKRRDAALSLARAAEARGDLATRALLFMEAGRAFERAGDPAAALSAFTQALNADAQQLGAALGRYRAHRATGSPSAAVAALEAAERATPDPRLRNELARKRARLLREVMGNPRAALDALSSTTSLPGLREKLRAAEACGDRAQLHATLEAWSRTAIGIERGLALVELASLQAKSGDASAATASLREAAIERAPQGLLAVARAAIAQARDSVRPVPTDAVEPDEPLELEPGGDATEALRSAVRLARDAGMVAQERAVLAMIAPTEPEHTLAEVLGFDAAAELSDRDAIQAGLLRELERLPMARRPGPALALLSLVPGERAELAARLGDELSATLRGDPLLSRFLAYRSSGPVAAARWLEEAEASSGEQAAFAAVMAGHHLRGAGLDCIEAFAEALDYLRGHPPACFALEIPARRSGDLVVLERVDRELATTTESRAERAGRRARLGLLSADNDLNHAVAWLELAAEERPDDPLTAELLLRLSSEASIRDYPERLLQVARLEASPPFARAYRLRAAAAFESSGLWHEAVSIYKDLLAHAPDGEDAFVRAGSWHALRHGHEYEALAAELERQVERSEAPGAGLLEDWADIELRRGNQVDLHGVLERLRAQRPSSHFALRGLARRAMDEGDDAGLLAISETSLRALELESERAAELRLSLRLRERLGVGGVEAAILEHEGRFDGTLWYTQLLESVAIGRSDMGHYYETALRIAGHLHDPIERAAYALRAAETLEATAPARALADLEPFLVAAPEHPLTLTTLARLHRAASSPRAAAEAFVRAAEIARDPQRSAELFHAAGVLFEEELQDGALATAAYNRVIEIDVTHADTFQRLRGLLRVRGEPGSLLALLGQRAAAPIDPELAVEIELERAELFRAVGDRTAAVAALRSALAHDPGRAEALRGLADLLWDAGEHHKAAEALVQLARITEDQTELAEVVFQLGSLYDEHLRDARRAELAFTRAASLTPDDPRPVERLVQLWKRTGQNDRAVRALQHLIANSWSVQTKEGYILELAATLDALGERTLAEQSLEDARRQAPTSMRVLRAQAEIYEREDDRTALSLHLQRSCNAMRGAIDDDPSDPSNWVHLIELLEKRGRSDGAELVLDAAYSCGLTSFSDRPRPQIKGLGSDALGDTVLRKLVTRGLLDPLRRLFREFHDELAEFLPTAVEITGPFSESQTRAVRGVAELFALPELRLVSTEPPVCVPVTADPLTLCVGQELFLTASEAERFFLVSRAVVVAKHGLMLLVRAAPERVLLALHALRTIARPDQTVLVANEREQRSVTRELAKRLPATRRTQLRPLLSDLMASEDLSTRRLATAAYEFGARVALTITGNLPAAINGLLRLRGKLPEEIGQEERLRLLRADPALRGLLSFAISEAYLDARREVLVPAERDPR